MKTLHSAILLSLGLLLPLSGFGGYQPSGPNHRWTPPTCSSLSEKSFSVDQCQAGVKSGDRLKQRWPSVAKIKETETQELCKSSASASTINRNRCQEAVDELKRLLNEREQAALERCGERQKFVDSCQACASNLSAAGCQEQNLSMNDTFQKNGQVMMAKRRELMGAAKRVEDEMFQLSEDYGQNISNLERDMVTNKQTSSASQEIGASSISEGLNKHGGASPAEIFRAVEELRSKSEVTSADMQEAQNIQSQYARESLTRALEAKAARLEMEKENQQDQSGLNDLKKNSTTVAKNTNGLTSVTPAASASEIGGTTAAADSGSFGNLAGAGAGVAGAGMGAGMAASGGATSGGTPQMANNTYGGGTFDPNSGATTTGGNMLNGIANNVAGAKTTDIPVVATAELAGENAKATTTGASRMSVRDALRAKLAAQNGSGKAGSTEASQAAGGKAGSMDAKLKAKAGANPDMLMGFSAAEFTAAGGDNNFSMAQSETDAAVKEMMTEFEGTLEGGEGMGMRHLASVGNGGSAPEILAEDSSDLFLRTRSFYERCQKRGCVTR